MKSFNIVSAATICAIMQRPITRQELGNYDFNFWKVVHDEEKGPDVDLLQGMHVEDDEIFIPYLFVDEIEFVHKYQGWTIKAKLSKDDGYKVGAAFVELTILSIIDRRGQFDSLCLSMLCQLVGNKSLVECATLELQRNGMVGTKNGAFVRKV